MALLSLPRSFSLPFSLSTSTSRCRCSLSSAAADRGSSRFGVAVVWFKHDLRIDDHPGLVAAASDYRALVPLYVFDRRILSRFSDDGLELVLFALKDLRQTLKEQGSDLMFRFGSAENVIEELVKEVRATSIFAEEEVEYDLRRMMDVVKKALETVSSPEGTPSIELWQTPFYDIKNLKNLPSSHDDFKKLKLPITSPLLSPTLPDAKMELDWGPLPSFDDLKEFMYKSPGKTKKSWTLLKETSAETILRKSPKLHEDILKDSSMRKKIDKTVFVTQKGNIVGGGTNSVLNALAGYLRYLEGTGRGEWQEVHQKLRDTETRTGASFVTLFGPALRLGVISRRRVQHEAIKYEKERNGGFLSPFGYSTATIAAAADAVHSMEWYWLMALKSQISDAGRYSIRIWRWNGYLIQYTVVGDEGPATLLVHGFGAFLEHYRDNIHSIAEGGNRVWAITILGFGKSEKPNVVYTELMWAELLRDFTVDVVGEPVHLVGNSIGGYFVAILAFLWPALAKSVVLINSAGDVIPGYSYTAFPKVQIASFTRYVFQKLFTRSREEHYHIFYFLRPKARQTTGIAWLGARFLLFYLRTIIKNIVKNCYPTKTERADDWLVGEMLRASHDPGVLVVLESIFSFDLSIPLNYLLKEFEEKVLVIQGMKDPISNSSSKLAMLKEHCPGVAIKELDAGHCPHDELPEDVNSIVGDWIETIESKLQAVSFL